VSTPDNAFNLIPAQKQLSMRCPTPLQFGHKKRQRIFPKL